MGKIRNNNLDGAELCSAVNNFFGTYPDLLSVTHFSAANKKIIDSILENIITDPFFKYIVKIYFNKYKMKDRYNYDSICCEIAFEILMKLNERFKNNKAFINHSYLSRTVNSIILDKYIKKDKYYQWNISLDYIIYENGEGSIYDSYSDHYSYKNTGSIFMFWELEKAISYFKKNINMLITSHLPYKITKHLTFFVEMITELFKAAVNYANGDGKILDEEYRLINKKLVAASWYLIENGKIKMKNICSSYFKIKDFCGGLSRNDISKYYQLAQKYREILAGKIFDKYESL